MRFIPDRARAIPTLFLLIAAMPPAAAAQPKSALSLMNEQQFCALFIRNAQQMAGMKSGPATITRAKADCNARTVQADYSLDFISYDQPLYINAFMQSARAGICINTDPSMVEFNKRGWAFSYTFTFKDGMVIAQKLVC